MLADSIAAERAPHPSIELRSLSKTYNTRHGEQVVALQDVSLQISQGEFVSVVGPSGCGKSTILQLITSLLKPSSGSILVQGSVVQEPRRDVGVVFQQALLLPWLKIIDNVLVPTKVQGLDMAAARVRARELLELVGLEGFENKYPGELSGGMQQRAAIVRALVNEPALLLMDEPFGALDAITREHMNVELQRIWLERRTTVLFITHSIPEAVFLGDRVVVMTPRPGRIAKIYDVDFPRRRDISLLGDPVFARLSHDVRSEFENSNNQTADWSL